MKQFGFCEKYNRNNLGEKFGICPECVKEEHKTGWNGEGLPPVGTVCEYSDGNTWTPVEIVFLSKWVIVMRSKANNIGNGVDIAKDLALNIPPDFRPLPDERNLAISDMRKCLTNYNKTDVIHACEQLYDAGYRKYSAKPGFEWRYVCSTCGCKVEPGEELPHGC